MKKSFCKLNIYCWNSESSKKGNQEKEKMETREAPNQKQQIQKRLELKNAGAHSGLRGSTLSRHPNKNIKGIDYKIWNNEG